MAASVSEWISVKTVERSGRVTTVRQQMIFYVCWHRITLRSSKADVTRALYAYLHPKTARVLYLGKADWHSVRQRMGGPHKDGVWEYLSDAGVEKFVLLVGEISSDDCGRFTSEMLADIESLLIYRLQPPANIQSKHHRIARPGMSVVCEGDWVQSRKRFIDV